MYRVGDTFRDEIYVYDADGELATPDSIDAAVLVVNGSDTAVSVTTDTSTTGIVKVSCSLAGRSAGDQFWVRVTATVAGVQQTIRTAIGRIGVNVVQWGDQSINAAQMTAGMIHAVAVDTSGSSLSTPIDAIKAKTDNLPASPAAQTKIDTLESRLTSARAGYLDKLNVSGTLAQQGDEMSLTDEAQTALVAALEAEIADDATGEAVKQAIVDKLIENLPDLDDLTLAAIAAECRDAILNTVLAGNHDEEGSLGALAQKLDVSGTLAHSDDADMYKADVSGLSTHSADDVVAAINNDDTQQTLQANAATAATEATTAATQATTAATRAQTILNRLGAWTGSARNTVLGAFQALFRKDADASVPSDVNADLGNGTGTADNTTDSVQAIRDRVDASTGDGGSGDGARTVVIAVTDAEASPLQNATVRLSEGAASFSGRTDAAGQVTFNVDDATYTVAITKAGYSFAGASLLVAGDDEQTYAMDAVSITPSAQPEQTTGHLVCYDEDGNTAAGVVIEVQLLGIDADGNAFSTTTRQETSGADGVVQFTNLWRGAYYRARRGRGTWVKFTAPDSASFAMPEVLGSP